jgi:hypothetical protein
MPFRSGLNSVDLQFYRVFNTTRAFIYVTYFLCFVQMWSSTCPKCATTILTVDEKAENNLIVKCQQCRESFCYCCLTPLIDPQSRYGQAKINLLNLIHAPRSTDHLVHFTEDGQSVRWCAKSLKEYEQKKYARHCEFIKSYDLTFFFVLCLFHQSNQPR